MESISLELVGLGRFMESGDESFKKGNLNSIWWFGGHLFWIDPECIVFNPGSTTYCMYRVERVK